MKKPKSLLLRKKKKKVIKKEKTRVRVVEKVSEFDSKGKILPLIRLLMKGKTIKEQQILVNNISENDIKEIKLCIRKILLLSVRIIPFKNIDLNELRSKNKMYLRTLMNPNTSIKRIRQILFEHSTFLAGILIPILSQVTDFSIFKKHIYE